MNELYSRHAGIESSVGQVRIDGEVDVQEVTFLPFKPICCGCINKKRYSAGLKSQGQHNVQISDNVDFRYMDK